jgi:hypothetical protein
MLNTIITLCSIPGLSFIAKESDGPWGLIGLARNSLIRNKCVGVFFFRLFECWACTGFWSSVAIYLISQPITLVGLVLWGCAGTALCMMFGTILERLER